MDHWLTLDSLIEVMLGISLSAAVGFRVFAPLLVLSLAAVVGGVNLPTDLDWVETPQALAVFAAACLLEVGGYYVPWFDHLLDVVATPAAIVAGTLVAAAVAPEMNPLVQWTLALVAGGGTAGLTKGLMNLLRGTSTAASGGLTNPLVATLELVMAIALAVLAITLPLVAGVIVLGILGITLQQLWTWLSRRRQRQPLDRETS
jgi:hypothetical protein